MTGSVQKKFGRDSTSRDIIDYDDTDECGLLNSSTIDIQAYDDSYYLQENSQTTKKSNQCPNLHCNSLGNIFKNFATHRRLISLCIVVSFSYKNNIIKSY